MLLQEKLVKRQLRSLDPDLYLEKQWSRYSGDYYVVHYRISGEVEPLTVADWRHKNISIPLSLSLIDRVRRQEGNVSETITQAIQNNRARKEQVRQERLQQQDEVAQEWQKSKPGSKLSVTLDGLRQH